MYVRWTLARLIFKIKRIGQKNPQKPYYYFVGIRTRIAY